MRIALLYALFAAISTAVNIGSQIVVHRLVTGPLELILALAVGTGAGLVVKYILDKRYIFAFTTTGLAHDGRLFVLYAAMSVVTTAIFWLFEFAFATAFASEALGYVGGVIGLAIGYVTKYQLDKRFVFRPRGGDEPAR